MQPARLNMIRNIDTRLVLKHKVRILGEFFTALRGRVLDLGCGRMPYRKTILGNPRVTEYCGIDIAHPFYQDDACRPDKIWDGATIPMADQSCDSVLLLDVLEHIFEPDAVLREAFRVTRPDGILLLCVPFFWPLHDDPYDFARYTPYGLRHLLEKAGFRDVDVRSLGDWKSCLANLPALYLRRGGLPAALSYLLSALFLPVHAFLLWADRNTYRRKHVREGAIHSAFIVTAKRPAHAP